MRRPDIPRAAVLVQAGKTVATNWQSEKYNYTRPSSSPKTRINAPLQTPSTLAQKATISTDSNHENSPASGLLPRQTSSGKSYFHTVHIPDLPQHPTYTHFPTNACTQNGTYSPSPPNDNPQSSGGFRRYPDTSLSHCAIRSGSAPTNAATPPRNAGKPRLRYNSTACSPESTPAYISGPHPDAPNPYSNDLHHTPQSPAPSTHSYRPSGYSH